MSTKTSKKRNTQAGTPPDALAHKEGRRNNSKPPDNGDTRQLAMASRRLAAVIDSYNAARDAVTTATHAYEQALRTFTDNRQGTSYGT